VGEKVRGGLMYVVGMGRRGKEARIGFDDSVGGEGELRGGGRGESRDCMGVE